MNNLCFNYLNTKFIEFTHNESKSKSNYESNCVEETNHLAQLMDWVLYNLLNENGKPYCIKLGHIVEENREATD